MPSKRKLALQHIVITGGSAGLGLSLARHAVKLGARGVTLMARTEATLKAAQEELASFAKSIESDTKVHIEVTDVTDPARVKASVASAVQTLGAIDFLFCNAGAAKLGYFHELPISAFEYEMRVNYFGVLHTVHAAYPDMVRRNKGHIVLVGSALSTFGMVGYSAYCPSKYAVRGLADALRNELVGTKVQIHMAVPPDMDTPGYATENQEKPIETKVISEQGGTLFTGDQVAAVLWNSILGGDYLLGTPDLGLQVNGIINKGLTPRKFPHVLLEMLLGFFGPVISWVYVATVFDKIAKKYAGQRFRSLWQS